MSPLAIPPLKWIGRRAARMVHGNLRSRHGYLLTRRHYIDDEQEWRLGQAYLGMLGLPLFIVILFYVQTVHADTGYIRGHRHVLGPWSDLPADLKILLPLAVIVHLAGFASVIRTYFVWKGIGSRQDIGE